MAETVVIPVEEVVRETRRSRREGARRGTDAATAAPDATGARPTASHVPAGLRWKDKGAHIRRRFEIQAYVGVNGSGKSLAMVHDTIPSLLAGRRVLSTVTILDPVTGEPHPLFEPLTSWGQLLQAEHCDVLFDEVQGIADARNGANGLPVQVRNFLGQLRRNDVTLRWTAPSWNWADSRLRDITKAVTVCRGHMSKLPDDPKMVWRVNRLFRWNTYDAKDFDRWDNGTTEAKLKGRLNAWFWRPGSAAEAYYDSLAPVSFIADVLESGRCAWCGGRRRVPECTCDDYVATMKRR